jgi:hypothetical protein
MNPWSIRRTGATIALGATLALSGCYNAAPEYRRLVESNATIAGKIAYVDCANHGQVVYSFVASDGEHRARAPGGMFDCRAAQRGDPVTVYYDPAHAQVNTLLSPQEAYEEARGWFVPAPVVVIGAPLLVILFNVFLYARRKSPRPVPHGNVK